MSYIKTFTMRLWWKRLFSTFVGLVVCGALVAGTIPSASANVPAVVPTKASSFKPTSKELFNDPHGSRAQEYVIIDELVRLIKATPRGAKIRMAYYWVEIMAVANALIAADNDRKVEVDILLDKKHIKEPAAQKLLKALKHGGKSKKSSAFYRKNPKRLMHGKFILFSRSGAAKKVGAWGSANASKKNAEGNGNDFRIRVNTPNYGCLADEFDRLANPKNTDITSGRICKSKGLVTQLTPVKGNNPWITLGTNHIKCTGSTTVRAVIMQWSDVAVAKAFLAKQAQGCKVELLVNRSTKKSEPISKKVLAALRANTKHGHVKVFVAKPGYGLHYKWMAVKGRSQAWTFTGSLHPMKGSQSGIQLVVREDSKQLTSSYMAQFKKLTLPKRAVCRSGCRG